MYIRESFHGDSYDSSADVTLLCPHGSQGEEFLREYGIRGKVADAEVFDRFNALETDKGSFELADCVAQGIGRSRAGILVRVIRVFIPRSVVDCNRAVSDNAVRNVVDWKEHMSTKNDLMGIHSETVAELKLKVAKGTKRHILLDLHTMADFSPVLAARDSGLPALNEQHVSLAEYVRLYTEAVNNGKPRKTNFITRLNDISLADERFSSCCSTELENAGFSVDFDIPYSLSERLMSTHYARTGRAITIDFKKGDLLGGTDLIDSQVDFTKVWKLAGPVVTAFAKYFA